MTEVLVGHQLDRTMGEEVGGIERLKKLGF